MTLLFKGVGRLLLFIKESKVHCYWWFIKESEPNAIGLGK